MALIQYITQIQLDFGAVRLLAGECERTGMRKPLATVPSVVGQDKNAAKATLQNAHFKVILQQTNSDEPAGQVISTNPAGGENVPQGTTVTVSFSDGPEQVPDVVGMKQADAEKAIRDAGFQPDVVESSSTTEPIPTRHLLPIVHACSVTR